jgi:Zn-dependent protease
MPQNFGLILFELFVMVFAISLHGCAQAWMANRQGDPTARMLGRITMNPAAHFDLFGTALWPLLSIFVFHNLQLLGWGKPVPMTYRNFPRKNGEMISVLAGPAAQFLAAIVALLLLVVLKHFVAGAAATLVPAILMAHGIPSDALGPLPGIFPVLLLLYVVITTSLLLCIFNLLPMPFLDGGRILVHFLPYNAARSFERYSTFFMIAFFFVGFPLIMLVFNPLMSVFNNLLLAL